jgi:hypothetical protein
MCKITPKLGWIAYIHRQNSQQRFHFTGHALERCHPMISCDDDKHLSALTQPLGVYKPRSGQIDVFRRHFLFDA